MNELVLLMPPESVGESEKLGKMRNIFLDRNKSLAY